MSPSCLDVPPSQTTGEAAPWHEKGQWGGGDWKKYPVGFGPFTKQDGGSSQKSMEHPHEPESIPLDRVREKGKREAAPAAAQQDMEAKRREGLRSKTHWRGRGQGGEVGGREKKHRRQDALRKKEP